MEIWRIEEGRLAEWWHVNDRLGMMQQFGVIPSPSQGGS
jgi:hypothetical protein